ncbi:LysR family transcriptional regulator [Streptomyces sp. NPDC058409]|uniref:LysR family transcriptional regulator n=1 Tax=Streptomyces sp. NPDC058409 TaxID=3346484 RepID=UPI003646F44C
MELRAFVAVLEEGGLSAAAWRLHVSQLALSRTVSGLERPLGVKLLVRGSPGVRATEAGTALPRGGACGALARHDQALRVMSGYTGPGGGALRIGIPLELPAGLLDAALAGLAEAYPDTRVQARHLSTAKQLVALRSGELDIGFLRERPAGPAFDGLLVVREKLGVLLAAELAGPGGIALDALIGLQWVGFPRPCSPAWYDELTAGRVRESLCAGSARLAAAGATAEALAEVRTAFSAVPNMGVRIATRGRTADAVPPRAGLPSERTA